MNGLIIGGAAKKHSRRVKRRVSRKVSRKTSRKVSRKTSRKSSRKSRSGAKRKPSAWAKFAGAYIKKNYRPGMTKTQRQNLMKEAAKEYHARK